MRSEYVESILIETYTNIFSMEYHKIFVFQQNFLDLKELNWTEPRWIVRYVL